MKTSVTTCTSIWMRLSFIRSRFDETGKKIHENHPVDKNPPKSTYQRNKSVNKVILLLITNSSPHKKANYLLSHKNHEHFFPVELTEHTHRAVWRPSILSSLSAKKKLQQNRRPPDLPGVEKNQPKQTQHRRHSFTTGYPVAAGRGSCDDPAGLAHITHVTARHGNRPKNKNHKQIVFWGIFSESARARFSFFSCC
jgi:hypothetical protein